MTASFSRARLVVTMMTPLAPRAPYSEFEAASLRTDIDSTSCGLIMFMSSQGIPSTMNSGLWPALMELKPRMRMDGTSPAAPEVVDICTPATFP